MRVSDVKTRGRQAVIVTNKPSGPPPTGPPVHQGLYEPPLLQRFVLKTYVYECFICMYVSTPPPVEFFLLLSEVDLPINLLQGGKCNTGKCYGMSNVTHKLESRK